MPAPKPVRSEMLLNEVCMDIPKVYAQLVDSDDPLNILINEENEAELDFNQPASPQRFGMFGRFKSTDRA